MLKERSKKNDYRLLLRGELLCVRLGEAVIWKATDYIAPTVATCPHGRSLRVTPCPPRGPLRLQSGKAGPAAPACFKSPHARPLRVALCPPRGPLRLRSGEASSAVDMTPTLFTSCNALPPEGAAAPAVWRSQSRGPCLLEEPPRTFASRNLFPFVLRYRRMPPRGLCNLHPARLVSSAARKLLRDFCCAQKIKIHTLVGLRHSF